jgi:hypothetical protein
MSKAKKTEELAQPLAATPEDNGDGNKPDYVIKQYRQLRTETGSKTRKEPIGAIWRDAQTGMLTIRFNGVQIISNDIQAFPVTYDFNG